MNVSKAKDTKMKDKESKIGKKGKKKDRNEIYIEMLEDELNECKHSIVENKKILAKSKKLEEDLRRDLEWVCVEWYKLKNKSVHVEVIYDELLK